MRAMRLEIVNLGEHLAEATHINRLRGNATALHQQAKLRENLLGAAEREHRNEYRTFPFEHALDRGGETVVFGLARDAGREVLIAARCLHDQDVSWYIFEARRLENGLILKTNVSGKKQRLTLSAHHDASGTDRVARIIKFQRRRLNARTRPMERSPIDFAIIFEALIKMGGVVHFLVSEERILFDA